MRRCYIAAPWWHPSPAHREWNTRRAELLAALARADGFEPVYVHRDLMDQGVDDDADPAGREAGLAATCGLIREIAREKGGTMWGLCLDSLWLSDGCLVERAAWLAERPNERGWGWSTSWNGYRPRMERAGILDEWQALAVAPC